MSAGAACGGDEASQGVQPRRLDLEDDVDPPQLMTTGVQDKGEANFPIMDTNKVMCEGTKSCSVVCPGSVDGKWSGVVLAPGVNPFWSAGVRHGAMVDHAMAVPRPDTLPPLAGPPRTFGPVQALGDGARQSGPVQALSSAGPVQALGSSGLAQAQVIFFKVGVLYRSPAHYSDGESAWIGSAGRHQKPWH